MSKYAQNNISLAALFKKLAREGIDLAQAEISLARAEANSIKNNYIGGAAFCAAAALTLLASVILLSESAVAALAPYVESVALAYALIAFVLLILTFTLVLVGMSYMNRKTQPVGTIFKWVAGERGGQ